MKIARGCNYCSSLLPTISIQTLGKVVYSICRACILEVLKEIEEPGEYPTIIEDRDADLGTIKQADNDPSP